MTCDIRALTRKICNASSKTAQQVAAVCAIVNEAEGTLFIKIERRTLQPGETVEMPGIVLAICPGDWPEARVWDAFSKTLG